MTTQLSQSPTKYEYHPACLCLPKMAKDEFAALCESMRFGFDKRHPVLLFEGMILDGRHRYEAATTEGVAPVFSEFTGDDPYDFVRREHEARRSWLSGIQKAAVLKGLIEKSDAHQSQMRKMQDEANRARSEAAKAGDVGRAATKKDDNQTSLVVDQVDPPLNDKPKKKKKGHKTRNILARATGTNPADVARAEYIEKNDPELFEQVKTGDTPANAAINTIKKRKLQEEVKKQNTVSVVAQSRVWCADAVEWMKIQEPADLILTDPPYMTDVPNISEFAASWLPLALSKLKSTGRAFVCVGAYPEELAAYLAVAMPKQILVWTYRNTMGPAPSRGYKLNWQAILYYEMPDAPSIQCPQLTEQFTVQDINAPDGRLNNRYHSWQKPAELGERFIRHSTTEGQVVMDPFCCTGTFILAAARLGRIGIGCDNNIDNLNIAIELGCKHES